MELNHRFFANNRATDEGVAFTRLERERHVYIVGKSGSGKTTTLFNIAMQDIDAGEGVTIIDPHGDLAEAVADCIPAARTHEVCYLNVADTVRPVGFNPLANIAPDRRALAASGRRIILDRIKAVVSKKLTRFCVSQLREKAQPDWQVAYGLRGTGSTFDRRLKIENLYERWVPEPASEADDMQHIQEFIDEIKRIVTSAIDETREALSETTRATSSRAP